MSPSDEGELHRLSDMLAAIDGTLPSHSPLREGLKKAGIALILAFIQGSRSDLEQQYEGIDEPLSDDQRAELVRWNINPEDETPDA
jgi:hypothetical protein